LKYLDDVDDSTEPLYLVIDKQKIGVVMRSLIESSLHLAPEHGAVEIALGLVSEDAGPPEETVPPSNHGTTSRAETYFHPKACMLRVTFHDTGPGISKVRARERGGGSPLCLTLGSQTTLETIFDDLTQFRPIDYQSGLGTALDLWSTSPFPSLCNMFLSLLCSCQGIYSHA
jgi:hypothetical protein